MSTIASPPATTAIEHDGEHHDKTANTIEIAATHSNDIERDPPQPTPATPAMDTSTTSDHDTTSATVVATPAQITDAAVASTRTSAAAAENPSTVLPMMSSGGADESKDEAPAAGEERDIQDGCQSSAERNIWSVFNPMWSIFVVNKARLPKKADRGADWAGTAGKPDGLYMFLGTKNPVNRK